MLIGRFYHHLEINGRVSLPKSFRQQHLEWVVTRGLDGGLFLFPKTQFTQQLESLLKSTFTKQAHRDFIRLMTNDAREVIVDKQGRVQLPEYLISFAQLTKDLVVVGSFNWVEIWDTTQYHQYLAKVEPQAAAIAETLTDDKPNS